MKKADRFRIDGGDIIEIPYDGTMHIAPCCGAQYATRTEAAQRELYAYLSSCGEDVPDEIEDLDIELHGVWID